MTVSDVRGAGPISFEPATDSELARIGGHLQGDGWTYASVDLESGSKEELIGKIGTALDFPSYFGNNWDALADAMSSIEVVGGLFLVIKNVSLLETADRETLFDIFKDAARVLSEYDLLIRVWVGPAS